jgi:pentatricopeptide repeat protein
MRTPFTLSLLAASLIYGLAVVFITPVAGAGAPRASQASPAQPSPARFDLEVRGDFFAGFSGQPERLARGMARTEEVLATTPDHPEALVWHGSGLLFRSGQAFQSGDTATGMELFGRGFGEMNRAVALAPDRVGVRIPRGATLLESTRFMPPAQAEPLLRLAVGDYEHALGLQAAVFDSLGGHARGELLFGLADGYARLGDNEKARQYFDRMTKEGGPSPRREYAGAWLSGAAPTTVPPCGPCHTL